jgi:hypothetical protein
MKAPLFYGARRLAAALLQATHARFESGTELPALQKNKPVLTTGLNCNYPKNQAGLATGLNEYEECLNPKCLNCQATCRFRRIRRVLAPNGSSINAPEMIVVGSGTAWNSNVPAS